ncbi:MAG: hypothetical protein WCJ17_02625, partial [bacterium]
MVNKYKFSVVACVALTFGALWASDRESASPRGMSMSLLGLEGEELRIKAHDWIEAALEEIFRDSPETVELLEQLDKQKFTVDFGDQILHRKVAYVLRWGFNLATESAAYDDSYGAVLRNEGHDVEDQGDFTSVEFCYWMLHKMLWDITRPCYENPKKTELIKWALFPCVYSMACEEDEEFRRRGVSLFSEFYFSKAILSGVPNYVPYYDELVTVIMDLTHDVYVQNYHIFNL